MIKLMAFIILSGSPSCAVAAPIRPVVIRLPGTSASISGYAIAQADGLGAVFSLLTSPIVAQRGSLYCGDSTRLSNMLIRSVQQVAPEIASARGVSMARIGSALVLAPQASRRPGAKIAVFSVGDSTSYRVTTMGDLAKAYDKAVAASPEGSNSQFELFEAMFDGVEERRLPGLPDRTAAAISPESRDALFEGSSRQGAGAARFLKRAGYEAKGAPAEPAFPFQRPPENFIVFSRQVPEKHRLILAASFRIYGQKYADFVVAHKLVDPQRPYKLSWRAVRSEKRSHGVPGGFSSISYILDLLVNGRLAAKIRVGVPTGSKEPVIRILSRANASSGS